jgi:hypothetical protein
MKNKKSIIDVNKLNGSQLADLCSEFLAKMGHRDTLRAHNLMAREWFRDAVILEEEDFPEELPRIRYYSELTGVPVNDVIRDGPLADWLYCCYPVRIERIEKERGIPSTLEVLPSDEMPKLQEAPLSWNLAPARTDLPN